MTATIPRDFDADPLATPIYWSTATVRNEHVVMQHRHRARPEGEDTFHDHGLWWPIGPVGRRAAREWSGS